MTTTIIKISILLALLVPVVGWPIACGSLLSKADNAPQYLFPAAAPWPSSSMVKDLRAASRDLKWDVETYGVQDLQYRMTSRDHDLPVFVAMLVKQRGGEAALERDWSNDFDSAPKYVVHARVPPDLASDMMDVEGNDPASVQDWLDRQYSNPADRHVTPGATAALVPVRVEFIGPHVEMMSIQFDVKMLPGTFFFWILPVLMLWFFLAAFSADRRTTVGNDAEDRDGTESPANTNAAPGADVEAQHGGRA